MADTVSFRPASTFSRLQLSKYVFDLDKRTAFQKKSRPCCSPVRKHTAPDAERGGVCNRPLLIGLWLCFMLPYLLA